MKKGVIISLILIFSISLASADFEVGNLSHKLTETTYGPEGTIKGWINMSFDDEPTGSIFEDKEGNELSLIDLLNVSGLRENRDYTCSVFGCSSDYTTIGVGKEIETFILNAGESKILGIKFEDLIININSASFKIESDAPSSCTNQIEINLFNDDTKIIKNNKTTQEVCAFEDYGCFDNSHDSVEAGIGGTPYCQRIKLPEGAGFRIGSWVKEEISGTNKLTMSLYDIYGNKKTSCDLNSSQIQSTETKVYCEIDYLNLKYEDYFVCISSGTGSGIYRIKGYTTSSGCGFNKIPAEGQLESAAYKIFVQGKKFKAVNEINITGFEDSIENYIATKYGSFDCTNDCIIPIKIKSNLNQEITIKDLNINYDKENFGNIVNKYFYNLSETPAKVSSNFIKIYLDNAGFKVKEDYGNYTFVLDLDGDKIFSEKVTIGKVASIQGLTPTTTASAFPTTFTLKVNLSSAIKRYEWDFGDTKKETTTKNIITHTYNSTGTYDLKVTIIDSDNRNISKTFVITVRTPEEEINKTLKKMQKDLTTITNQIKDFELFIQTDIKSYLNLSGLDDTLKNLQRDFAQASSESDYNKIMGELLELNVPSSIRASTTADSLDFYPEKNIIDMDVLASITGKSYDTTKEKAYTQAVLSWHQLNINAKIDFKEIVGDFGYGEAPILNTFKLSLSEKVSLSGSPYLIFKKMDNLNFKADYGELEESGYVYIKLTNPTNTISFTTTEDVNFVNLPAFITPEISELVIGSGADSSQDDENSKWFTFILVAAFVLVGGFIVYIILQEWYRKRYEEHLFKNRNNLFNLLTYIENTKRKGLKSKEIVKKLEKAGWNSEQIRYAMRKHIGKRTGMIELPIRFKSKETKKMQSKPEFFSPRKPFKRF